MSDLHNSPRPPTNCSHATNIHSPISMRNLKGRAASPLQLYDRISTLQQWGTSCSENRKEDYGTD